MGGRSAIPPRARVVTGTFTGNGIDNRNIDIGADLTSKRHVYIIIKTDWDTGGVHRIEYGQGDATMLFLNEDDEPDCIQTLTVTGFQVGQNARANGAGHVMRYIVFWEDY